MERTSLLLNAPIREALIDLSLSAPVGFEAVEAFRGELAPESGKIQQTVTYGGQLRVEQSEANAAARVKDPASLQPVMKGYALWSKDEKTVVQGRSNGFSLSRLAPYEKWEPFRDLAKATFERYARVTGATSVARCGVRYINQIAVEPGTDLADYLLTAPTLAPTLPQEMADLFMRVVVSKPPAKVILTEALERPHQRPLGGAGPELAVILDIDAFYDDASFAVDDPKLWETLELLRKVKNEVFFGCLTEKALEAYRR